MSKEEQPSGKQPIDCNATTLKSGEMQQQEEEEPFVIPDVEQSGNYSLVVDVAENQII